jgi:iron complex outermembrane receptor protein
LSDDNVSWDLSGIWSVNDGVNLYARIATGFRGASVQPAGPFGAQSVAEPETNTSYEVGVKADLWDRTAKVYFNLFHYEVKDQQLTAVGGANNAVRLLNANKTVGQGAELDFQAYLTDNLLMTLAQVSMTPKSTTTIFQWGSALPAPSPTRSWADSP